MKLHAEVDEKEYVIEISRQDDQLEVSVDGRTFDIDISEPESGVFLLKHDGNIYEAFVSTDTQSGATKVTIKGVEFDVSLFDPRRLRSASGSDHDSGGIAEIKTAMPGKVVRILVAKDGEVQKGDGVIVVEAMKMQNEMKAPKNGKVKNVAVQEGDTVGAGEVLVTIE